MGQFKTIYWAVYRPAGILGWFEKWQQVPHSTFWNEEQVIDVIVKHKEQNKK
jgi:hypothetical protein